MTSPTSNKTQKPKLKYLEGLRGIAAFVVVLCHLSYTFAYEFTNPLLESLKVSTGSYVLAHLIHSSVSIFFDGSLAVHIFWFMSAYVISIKLFSDQDGLYLLRSFTKRYLRLFIPVFGSVLFAYLLYHLGFMYNIELAHQLGDVYVNGWLGYFYKFESNAFVALKLAFWDTFFSADYSFTHSYNPCLWTMHPEFYGSMFCFLLFGVVGKHKLRYYFYLIIAIINFILGDYWVVSFLWGLLMSDIDFGSDHKIRDMLGVLFRYQIINLGVFFCLLMLGGKQNYYECFDLFISAGMVILIIKTPFLQKVFEGKWMIWLGKISFSLYLLHFPIICSFACYSYLVLPLEHYTKIFLVGSLTMILSLLLSYVFMIWIDKSSVRLANWFANRLFQKTEPK